MTQMIKVLTAKPGDLSSVLGMHRMKGENLLLKIVLSPPHVWGDMSVLLHTKQTNKCNKIINMMWSILTNSLS